MGFFGFFSFLFLNLKTAYEMFGLAIIVLVLEKKERAVQKGKFVNLD